MKIRTKEKIAPIYLTPDDTIQLIYKEKVFGMLDGRELGTVSERVVLTEKIGHTMILTEAVIFDVEKGDFGDDVKDGIGGAFLET